MGLRVARGDQGDRPAAVHPRLHGEADARRPGQARHHPHRGSARQSAITTAEGQKAAAILSAEGKKQAAILEAEAERQSRILRAEVSGPPCSCRRRARRSRSRPSSRPSTTASPTRGCWPTSTCRRCRRSRRATPTRCGSCPASSARRWRGCPARRCRRRGQVLAGRRTVRERQPSRRPRWTPPAGSSRSCRRPPTAREAKIELSSIADAAPAAPQMPVTPSLTQAKEEVREIGSAELPARGTQPPPQRWRSVHWSAGPQ